ncbi:MAG TPA: DUF1992 domain-containing protein [Ornithinimicrobium sp.]|uniref:DnaJ family domain-containing protein n=1 Tax=Ornithinimicrobium sp. TaxID=1977084 RepID=UPI002B49B374|nr:DUF1992 domain-containing protein [Ornithinimicrobium sp.]HKJ13069.1 DUF1992 domain-containing protein [Ornithinimicrobium sp.]
MAGTSEERGPTRRGSKDEPAATAEQIETWVEHTIRQAQRRGDFDALPGAGEPLASLDRPHDPDWWVRQMLQREKVDLSAALPGPMALRRERATYPEALADIADEDAVRAALEDFNERVLADRRRPVATQASPVVAGRVDVEEMVQRWRVLRDEREATLPADDAEPPVEPAAPASAGRRRRRRRRIGRAWFPGS